MNIFPPPRLVLLFPARANFLPHANEDEAFFSKRNDSVPGIGVFAAVKRC